MARPLTTTTPDGALALARGDRPGRWPAALAGLTPGIVAIAAALLLARALSFMLANAREGTTIEELLLWQTLYGYVQIVLTMAPVLFAIVIAGNLGPRRGPRRIAVLAIAIVLGSALGVVLRLTLMNIVRGGFGAPAGLVLSVGLRTMLLAAMLALALEAYRGALATIEDVRRAEVGREALERELAGSRLQALQAQIEPHFLFNTLANVRRLCDVDPPQGRAMLASLLRYLQIALPRMRESEVALGSEAELVAAYLQIHRVRMGGRLRFEVAVTAGLHAHPVPPLMLLTLVENAVKHGIQPSSRGGAIRVGAHEDQGQLILTVADSGVGFTPGSGSGTGLANVRARLAAQFGSDAALSIVNNDFDGVTATIRLPLRTASCLP